MSRTTTVKTTINMDDEKLARLKRTAQNLYGDSRSLSELVEDAAESFDAEAALLRFLEKMGWEAGEYPSLREIEERRPESSESSVAIIREMRESRENRLLGHEQPR